MPRMEGGSSGEENANLYVRGAEEGSRGEQPDPSEFIELLDIFGKDGLRSYPRFLRHPPCFLAAFLAFTFAA